MRVGVVIPTYDLYLEDGVLPGLIREVERLGFHSVWFGDHIIVPEYARDALDPNWHDALTTAIFGAGLTTTLTFGTDVLVAPYRSPVLLAKMAATLSSLSGGRFILGLGVGWLRGEFEALNTPPYSKRGKVTDEYLKVIRTLLETEGPVSFKGDFVNFEQVYFGPRPAIAPPLLIGGNHPRGIERAALLGDGWHPLFPFPEAYAEGRSRIVEMRARAGLGGPFIFSYCGSQTRLLGIGDPAPTPAPPGPPPADDFNYAPPAPSAPDGRTRFIGTAQQLREDFAVYAEAGVEQLVIRLGLPRDPVITPERFRAQLQGFASEVLPFCATL